MPEILLHNYRAYHFYIIVYELGKTSAEETEVNNHDSHPAIMNHDSGS